jgi:transcriptional regulator with PAS, ATPase and Fis domain
LECAVGNRESDMKDRSGYRISEAGKLRLATPFIGESRQMIEILRMIAELAPTDIGVLLMGESGTGKELIARAVHDNSQCTSGPYLALNCAGMPETLIESEFFGHAEGSFTGAKSDKMGLIEAANGGTLFLDEIGDMSLTAQAKVLRVLETKEVLRIGERRTRHVSFRVVSATNIDLKDASAKGSFRLDLFYRLGEAVIHIPPLRERKEDIPRLASHFYRQLSKDTREELSWRHWISPEALDVLMEYDFPGNVRELRSIMRYAAILSRGGLIDLEDLPEHVRGSTNKAAAEVGGRVARDALLSALMALTVPGNDGSMRKWRDIVRAASIEEICNFLVHSQGKEFTRRDLSKFLSGDRRDDKDKYATAGRYLRILRNRGVLKHNGAKANAARYMLADAFPERSLDCFHS